MKAVILSIGDELTLGQTVDTNSAYLSDQLVQRGIFPVYHETIPDDQDMIAAAVERAASTNDVVLITGGLGPTDDDLTRQAVAQALGTTLELDEESLQQIEDFFIKRGRVMSERNRVQAMCPMGAITLANSCGTAPGLRAKIHNARIYVMPGVPKEMRAMFERQIATDLPTDTGKAIRTAKINTIGKGESDIAEILGDLADRERNPLVGTTAANGVVSIRIRSEFPSEKEADTQLAATIDEVEAKLGDLVFGRDDVSLPIAVGNLLKEHGKTVFTAESCTGGTIGKLLTDTAGSSAYYVGGAVTYSNKSKRDLLGVSIITIAEHGAVSETVAKAMAEGGLEHSHADYAISITGIAGPDGGTESKPVGTVWIGVAGRDGKNIDSQAHHFCFPGDRDMIRMRAAMTALNLLRVRVLHDVE